MRAFVAAAVLAIVLGGAPVTAFADEGDTSDADVHADDPGITALHDAITDMREASVALRAECPERSDAACRDAFKKVRESFKAARQKAIEAHHAFKQEQKSAREAARHKAKDSVKPHDKAKDQDKASDKDKGHDEASDRSKGHSPEPKGTPKAAPAPRT
ncbi:MAG TPA: hypothetical protein VFV20_00190 [Candidatus Limnocylindria bacterium]|nr:hypothetical protein [Candidatus Limnocylindria bacterium]